MILQDGVELWTYQDVVDHLVDTYESKRTGRTPRNARRAILNSYRDMPNRSRWSYFERRVQITTSAAQSTGTVAFDLTGGTFERQLTLTGATWPSWAAQGRVIINDESYTVEDRKSDTVITLNSNSSPAADVAAGASYSIHRPVYQLPVNVRRISPFVEISRSHYISYVSPREIVEGSIGNYEPQRSWYYTIRQHEDYVGGMAVEFHPPPNESRTYYAMAEVKPRTLSTEKESTGTITVSADSAAVVGTGTAFASTHVGDIMRFTTSASEPTGLAGNDSVDNPYAEQHAIKSVTDAENIVLETPVASGYTGKPFTISSPIDMEHSAMFTLFLRMAEAEFATLMRLKTDVVGKAKAQVREALIQAKASDSRHRDLDGHVREALDYFTRLKDFAVIGESA